MENRYDVFISYSRKDYVDENKKVIPNNVVSQIKDLLSKEGISYWFDEEGIYSGQNFTEKIVTNIEASTIFLFISTANANESKWTGKEIATADELGKHIIPVRIDKSPYNKSVLFRIANLDYIEYYVDSKRGKSDIVRSIKAYLKEQAEQRKIEEAKREEEEKKRLLTEAKIKEELKRKSDSLSNVENKHYDKRNEILTMMLIFLPPISICVGLWMGMNYHSFWLGFEIALSLAWLLLLWMLITVESVLQKEKGVHFYIAMGLLSVILVIGIHSGIYLSSWWKGLCIGVGLIVVDFIYVLCGMMFSEK